MEIIQAKVFSVPFQAIESPKLIQEAQQLGVDVIDMESAAFLAVANHLQIPAICLLWCTDLPNTISYYVQLTKSGQEKQHRRWKEWAEIVAVVGFGISTR